MNEFIIQSKFQNINFLINNSFKSENKIIVGTRGWSLLQNTENEKIIARELIRLENSIKDGIEKYGTEKEIICMMHYPPVVKSNLENSPFIELMNKYNIKTCIYGHLHGSSHEERIEGTIKGIKLSLISSDFIKFNPVKIV